ncbi:MAG TPA: MFS transporter [Methylomirabilota bacterium]|jgi:MFS family permease|nr:MFS transporter [Methylomirabilota bacterium]
MNRWVMLLVIFFTRTALGFQFQSIAALTPFLVAGFDLSFAQVGLLMGLFMLPGVVLALPGGLLGQRFGSLRVVVAGLALLIVGGTIVSYSGGFDSAAIGRTLGGAGGVLVNIMLARMVADWFRGRELQTAMGIMLAAWPFGMALALMILGPLAAESSWRLAEYATVVAAGLALGLVGLVYQAPPGAPAVERATLRLNVPRRVWALAVSAGVGWALLNASVIVVASFAPSFLMSRGSSVTEAGLITGAALWISIVAVPIGGLVADRVNRPRLLIVAACLAATITIACIARAPVPALWMVASGILLGLPPSIMMSLLPRAVAAEHLSTALGVYYGLFYLGMAVSQTLAGLLRDLTGDPGMPLLFAAVLMAATVPAVFAFWRLEGRAAPEPEEAIVGRS